MSSILRETVGRRAAQVRSSCYVDKSGVVIGLAGGINGFSASCGELATGCASWRWRRGEERG
jgi:hypothetical protein